MFSIIQFENAKYVKSKTTNEIAAINATVAGQKWSIPLDENNTMYAEIKRQVDAGELTIEDAD
jgi:hypothetical protein